MQMEWNDRFPATAWSLIRNVGNHEGAAYRQAMNALIASYWRPVFYFIRSRGYPIQQAEDLTQEFFLKVCEKHSLSKADPKRGRFRTFLLTILVRFLSDQGPNRIPRQRGFDNGLVSISTLVRDDERMFEPTAGDTPEDAFMKQWALATLNQALENLRLTCEQRKYPAWYAMFLAYHFPDEDQRRPTKVSLATRFNLTEDRVKYGLEQANAMFSELLRAELKDQVLSVDDLDDELQELERWLTKASKEQKRGVRADGPTSEK